MCRRTQPAQKEYDRAFFEINDMEKHFLELALDFSMIYRGHADVVVKNAEVIADYIWSFEDSFYSWCYDESENIHTAFLEQMSKDMLFTPSLEWMEDCA